MAKHDPSQVEELAKGYGTLLVAIIKVLGKDNALELPANVLDYVSRGDKLHARYEGDKLILEVHQE